MSKIACSIKTVDGARTDAAQAELDAAGEDQRERDRLIAIEQKKLDGFAPATRC